MLCGVMSRGAVLPLCSHTQHKGWKHVRAAQRSDPWSVLINRLRTVGTYSQWWRESGRDGCWLVETDCPSLTTLRRNTHEVKQHPPPGVCRSSVPVTYVSPGSPWCRRCRPPAPSWTWPVPGPVSADDGPPAGAWTNSSIWLKQWNKIQSLCDRMIDRFNSLCCTDVSTDHICIIICFSSGESVSLWLNKLNTYNVL